jgi:hypothetical protein
MMGRPRKVANGLTVRYSFRLSSAESETFSKKVQESGMMQSEFLRDCVLKNRTTVLARPVASLEKQRMQFLFNKTSNNLNQIAHVLNGAAMAGSVSEARCGEVLENLIWIANYLKAALDHVD